MAKEGLSPIFRQMALVHCIGSHCVSRRVPASVLRPFKQRPWRSYTASMDGGGDPGVGSWRMGKHDDRQLAAAHPAGDVCPAGEAPEHRGDLRGGGEDRCSRLTLPKTGIFEYIRRPESRFKTLVALWGREWCLERGTLPWRWPWRRLRTPLRTLRPRRRAGGKVKGNQPRRSNI